MDREVWWATVCGVAKELRFFGMRHDLATQQQQQQQSSAFYTSVFQGQQNYY